MTEVGEFPRHTSAEPAEADDENLLILPGCPLSSLSQ
jgi:hypothetical protein